MLEKDRASISDCIYAIEKIETYVKGILSAEELYAKQETYDAALMNFLVIAEACKRISDGMKSSNPHIDWRGIADFRNFLAHDYFGVDATEVWSAIKYNLPELKAQMKELLAKS